MRDLSDEEQTPPYRFAHVALPEDTIDRDPWEWHGGQDWRRYVLTRECDVNGIWVSVGGEDQCTTSDRQRLIDVLIEAGRLLDALG